MKIEIWSDFACPFCYLGDRKLALALETLPQKEPVDITYRSFQLDVHASAHPHEDLATLIAKKYGVSYDQAKKSNDQIVDAAKKVGLSYDFENIKPNNTGLAHQVLKYAGMRGKDKAIIDRFFKACFEEGYDLGQKEVLLHLASEVGVDPNDLNQALTNGDFAQAVESDQLRANKLGITGVPYFVINDQYAISGAQDVAYFQQALSEIMAAT